MKKTKLAAPIIVAIVLGLWFLGMIAMFLLMPSIPLFVRLLLIVIPAALLGVVIFVLVQRINEIRSGEDDDLGKY